jgi:hypothetical protein
VPAIGSILFLLNVFFIIHAARTGRFWPWAPVMFFLPGFGLAAYLIFEVLPEWRGAPRVRKTQTQLVKAMDPTRRYRALREEAEAVDTLGNRLALAQECLELGKYEEARTLYDGIIHSPQGDEPVYYLGRARAEFGLATPEKALATLDELKSHWPDYRSHEGHLLYARSLEMLGRAEDALGEYANLARNYAGPEPRIRQMRLLDQMGRKDEARAIAQDVVAGLKRAPDFARKQQAEWFSAAKVYLRS